MKTFTIRYSETYTGYYEVSADSRKEAIDKLRNDIMEGRRPGPDECTDSTIEVVPG